MLTIVIGDIHGMAAKLENLLGQIDMWCAANARAALRQLIFLGDYIDRGPEPRQVLQSSNVSNLRALSAFGAITKSSCFERRNRKGTLQTSSPTAAMHPSPPWAHRPRSGKRKNGSRSPDQPRRRTPLLCSRRDSSGRPPDQQTAETKLWIRDSFLRHRGLFPKYIVHGHTPTIYLDPQQTRPDVRDNRCNVDTGAGMNGPFGRNLQRPPNETDPHDERRRFQKIPCRHAIDPTTTICKFLAPSIEFASYPLEREASWCCGPVRAGQGKPDFPMYVTLLTLESRSPSQGVGVRSGHIGYGLFRRHR